MFICPGDGSGFCQTAVVWTEAVNLSNHLLPLSLFFDVYFEFPQVSSYGGYLRYRLHTQTMRGDVLSLPAEASRPDIILKVPDRTLGSF